MSPVLNYLLLKESNDHMIQFLNSALLLILTKTSLYITEKNAKFGTEFR